MKTALFVIELIGVFCSIVGVACCFGLIRNNWVYNFRAQVLNSDIDAYMKMVGYNEMMQRFWVWRRDPKAWTKEACK